MGSAEMNPFTYMLSKPIDIQRLQSLLTRLLRSRDAVKAADP
jgi:hypothetical protein